MEVIELDNIVLDKFYYMGQGLSTIECCVMLCRVSKHGYDGTCLDIGGNYTTLDVHEFIIAVILTHVFL